MNKKPTSKIEVMIFVAGVYSLCMVVNVGVLYLIFSSKPLLFAVSGLFTLFAGGLVCAWLFALLSYGDKK